MTDTMTSQNIDLSSWDTLYNETEGEINIWLTGDVYFLLTLH
jgi:hypothetical protein